MELKKLASQTAVYGLSSMVGRFLNFLLIPLYTSQFLPEEYGVVTVMYAYVGFFVVFLSMGFETAFFNFTRKEFSLEKVFTTSLYTLLAVSIGFSILGLFFAKPIAALIGYPSHPEYVQYFTLILAFDNLSVLPFALLRKQNKAIKFAVIKMAWIVINIGLNLYFVYYGYQQFALGNSLPGFDPEIGVAYIFIANLVASAVVLLCLIPEFKFAKSRFDKKLFTSMLSYAWPLILVGFAGSINELLDRIILKYLLPPHMADYEIGIYGAFYKLSIIITLFVQAFRFAGEPFFFERSKAINAQLVYAKVMNVFVAVCGLVFLFTMLFVDEIAGLIIRQEAYYAHPDAFKLVPVLLMANIFLGIYYNLSIWYKLSEKTFLGSTVALGGAVLTIVLNLVLVPLIGIMGAAITTMLVYGSMAVSAFIMGQKYYPVPYQLKRIGLYLFISLALWQFQTYFITSNQLWIKGLLSIVLIGMYAATVYFFEIKKTDKPQE